LLNGNIENQIQPYILLDKINLENVEILISILKATFGDHNQVGTISAELDKLTQGNKEFCHYYVEFQYLMAILDYDGNAKKAGHKHSFLQELQIGLIYHAKEPQAFVIYIDLCIKLDYRIHAHAVGTKYQTTLSPP
jgi:hypothetical protein